ncbi:hypothetical protein OC846_001016 [Tilletia horrida]|uniref:Pre-mRNA-splicing factor 18 n=1 Tax=Tilletia horrida TaxID=155126 RepID=A0AAN6GU48_9BASI|nr:hypothetical protein OC846_001016 [Tilletia horrida]KAK0567365.1 hypothetical protein OC861_002775 [Tilletia horrida]
MDALKAELEAKKKRKQQQEEALLKETERAAAPTESKYVRRRDRIQVAQDDSEQQQQQQQQQQPPSSKRRRLDSPSASKAESNKAKEADEAKLQSAAEDALAIAIAENNTSSAASASSSTTPAFNISPEEAIRRLRAKGHPIRLFGESDKDRRLRLRALELLEERGGGSSTAGQNDFMRALAKAGQDHRQREQDAAAMAAPPATSKAALASPAGGRAATPQPDNPDGPPEPSADPSSSSASAASGAKKEGIGMDQVLDLNLVKSDPNKLYPIIYHTLKGLLKDWAQALADRPEHVRMSTQGKLAAATQVQASEYLQPLFKLLRKRSLAPDVLARLSEIVHYVQKREYRHANDSYLQLSIGNAPWPIGVTMVGIHERSGREKIFSSNVAHVLNDEVSRKYIQSLKRLMTFAQTKYPPASTAMLMG